MTRVLDGPERPRRYAGTLRRDGPTARQPHAGLTPACDAVSTTPRASKSQCKYSYVTTRDEAECRAEAWNPTCPFASIHNHEGQHWPYRALWLVAVSGNNSKQLVNERLAP
jgi:hypothetical protein